MMAGLSDDKYHFQVHWMMMQYLAKIRILLIWLVFNLNMAQYQRLPDVWLMYIDMTILRHTI